jgi:hypothetical protein
LRDSRPRRWLWSGYGPNDTEFAAQWAFLESLDAKAGLANGFPATVGIWEDVSGVGGFSKAVGSARTYTPVRVVQVSRQPRRGGGPVTYEAVLEFQIEDSNYTAI